MERCYIHNVGMFKSKCKGCSTMDNDVYYNWSKLVVIEDVFGGIQERNCIPCHEEKYGKLKPIIG